MKVRMTTLEESCNVKDDKAEVVNFDAEAEAESEEDDLEAYARLGQKTEPQVLQVLQPAAVTCEKAEEPAEEEVKKEENSLPLMKRGPSEYSQEDLSDIS
jgi:hypothetical protein